MLDIAFIRENKEVVEQACKSKGLDVDLENLLKLDEKRRELIKQVEIKRKERNELAASVKSGKPSGENVKKGKQLKEKLAQFEQKLTNTETKWLELLKLVPNIPYPDVPLGKSEDDNVVDREWGKKPKFNFKPRNHWELAEARGWIDKERAARVTGSRFAYLKGDLVLLQWALMQFGMDRLTDPDFITEVTKKHKLSLSGKAFMPVLPPLMIKTDIYDAMDRLEPREDRYKVEGEELWLQGSAEHVIGSMHMGEIFEERDLPIRYVGFTTSFRKEAGSYGKDLEGIIRMHQFDKLEMESLSTPETSFDEHLLMIKIQETFMQELGLPYQVINKCTADIGKPNARGWDINAWLPGQGKYRETHTADYMTDYQARRLRTRLRRQGGEIELVHTNDATVFSQRPLIAILENYQLADGRVTIPSVLTGYLKRAEL